MPDASKWNFKVAPDRWLLRIRSSRRRSRALRSVRWNGCTWKAPWLSLMEIVRMPPKCSASACARCATKSGSMVSHRGGTHNMATPPTLDALQGYLKVVTERQQMIVSNMANVDTPGDHTKDIDFQTAMRQVMNGNDSVHMESASMELQGLQERPDGNNVNIDRESLMLSQTQLQFQLGIQLVKREFNNALTAIKEGS